MENTWLLLQGCPDMPIVRTAATTLYPLLVHAGVRIFEYQPRPFHGKVALVDRTWSTVGSSNLDPLSLALNLEANVVVDDADFNASRVESACAPATDYVNYDHLLQPLR